MVLVWAKSHTFSSGGAGKDRPLVGLVVPTDFFLPRQMHDAKYYRALERGRQARRRGYHVSLMETIVTEAMMDLFAVASEDQQLKDGEIADDRTWKSWMDLFLHPLCRFQKSGNYSSKNREPINSNYCVQEQ